MAGRLEGKVAVVTGASSGIGEAIAIALAREGASVALGARRLEELQRVGNTIEADGGKVFVQVTDVVDRAQVKALANATEAGNRLHTLPTPLRHDTTALGPIDIWVNNAGVMYFTKMKNLHEDEWERMIDVNCKGVVNGIGAALGSGMVARGGGHIVTISSDAGRRVFPQLAVYCGTKYFVEATSEGLRRELVGTGVRVTTIQPGDVATDLVMHNTDAEAAADSGVQIGQKVGVGLTQNQVLKPEDVAAAVLYTVTAPPHVAVNEVLVEPRDQG
ncbi:unnamed protein product [Phaeothamnion confervicola]